MKKIIGIGILIIIFLTVLFGLLLCRTHEVKTNKDVITISDKTNVRFNKYDLTIRLNKIVDSRCPKDVNCIRAGEITYYLDIKYNNKKYSKTVDSDQNKSVTIEDIIINVENYSDNSVTLRITKK